MPTGTSDDEWHCQHHAEALSFLRQQLIWAVKPHLTVLGHEGHLTLPEIRSELLSLYAALPEMAVGDLFERGD